jgi:4'-phosphopantetheinyl transferase
MRSAIIAVQPTAALFDRLRLPSLLLTPEERRRGGRLRREVDRRDFVAAHALVRLVAAVLLGVRAEALDVRQRCATCAGDHGQPRLDGLPDVFVSLAHSDGVVAAAASDRPVGIDAERLRGSAPDPALEAAALAPQERATVAAAPDRELAFLLHWVRKEALVKRGSFGLESMAAYDLGLREVAPPDAERRLRYAGLEILECAIERGTAVAAAAGERPHRSVQLDELVEAASVPRRHRAAAAS